ncbi:hypothetical protein ACRE_048140 [Hapsidospora chrysogenum ATCC 11550]|uniref:Serine hydrolase domain-containing protein n=1 Tax=Hapsidospora chrysogenum (strain ATCC 11550 / CBS 779.69 / DSM 880 / IAM 14645 / JCM 23072 / IMI 49137) TaxID=857340 RepID=A0A086T4V8_HAPC1|nr:hypothetical protein ACRE_048140 [Hapsidospora chrysogenum ATCC 11550]
MTIPGGMDPSLRLPRILCLHGGGTNSRIFSAQCRIVRRHLEGSFRLVFADGPYLCDPGPDVTSVYADWGPFRSWIKSQPEAVAEGASPFATPPRWINAVVMPVHEEAPVEVIRDIDSCLSAAMQSDDRAGATGEWVGLLGFSQGARMAASLLLRAQSRMVRTRGRAEFGFAVVLAGSGPLVALDPECEALFGREDEIGGPLLWLPTVHMHGLRDGGLAIHRDLLDRCCFGESAAVVEWDGDHRVPIKTEHVAALVSALMDAYRRSRTSSAAVRINATRG